MVDPIDAPADEPVEPEIVTAGQRLRAAREEKGLTLEDVAAQTRIPRRHLESLENGDWERLPAPTYTNGFAKSYASVVGLDRVEIGDQLRAEMGGHRPTAVASEVFEPVDPARTMPKWLVFGAIAAVLLLVLVMTWLNERAVQGTDEELADSPLAAASEPSGPVAAPAAATAAAEGAVAITANEPVWIQVYEKGGAKLFEGVLAAGQRYDVPTTATAPLLRTAKAEALRISVGTADAPQVGPAATTLRDISLLGPDLMRGPAAAAAPATRPAATRPAAPPPSAPASPPVVQNTAG